MYRLFYVITFFLIGCRDTVDYNTEASSNGRELSEMYCASCHKYPEPTLLNKDTWEKIVLPRMGYMFGIYNTSEERASLFENNEGGKIVRESNLFPEKRRIDSVSWSIISDYYISNAPEQLEVPETTVVHKELSQFKVLVPKQSVSVPSTTMVQFSNNGLIYHGDAKTKSFSIFDQNLKLKQSGNVPEGTVSLNDSSDAFWLTIMGSFSPTDMPNGLIAVLPKNNSKLASAPITGLQRPVHACYDDFNGDGITDIVVCEFGKWTGALSLFLKSGEIYEKKILRSTPGAIKAYSIDMNNDGYKDIVALFAQGDEGIDIYYNDGNANFKRQRALRFPATMGSSYFKLIDYNKDGHMDILYTAGDNADYKPILKPWHGVYLFKNNGKNTFEQEVFLHLNGAYNAVAEDFDDDGDVDIAAISFFPDFVNTPEESFVYFKNHRGAYTRNTFSGVNDGRWVVMDASDYDQDGDVDLILGSLAFEVIPKLGYVDKWIEKGIPFIVLENTNQ